MIEDEGKESEWLAMGLNSLDDLTARDIGRAAAEGNEIAVRVFEGAGECLGIALASVINLLNPEAVVIGGGVAHAGKPLFRAIEVSITRRTMGPSRQCVEILPARFGDDSGVIGAAMMAVQAH